MITEVWSRLGVAAAATEFSQAVDMGDDNSLSMTITVFAGALGANGVQVWESNDLENWAPKGSSAFASMAIGSALATTGYTGISSAYVRLKIAGGASASVVSVTLNTAKL
jgi:hypothetical protein